MKYVVTLLLVLLASALSAQTNIRIGLTSGTDDCQRSIATTFLWNSGGSREMGKSGGSDDYNVGFRFQNVTIPIGATVDSAFLKIRSNETKTYNTDSQVYVTIRCEDTGNATVFSTYTDFDARSWTTANTSWNDLPTWTNATYYLSDNFASALAEVVARGDWASGNSVVVTVKNNGSETPTSYRRTRSCSGDCSQPDSLLVWYHTGGGGPATDSVTTRTHSPSGIFKVHSPSGTGKVHKP